MPPPPGRSATTTTPPPQPGALQPRRPNVFVSYSRVDKAFVDDVLVSALTDAGKTVWLDRRDIEPAADWRERVQRGIEAAAAFVFVLTPGSARSAVCLEELEQATRLGKRVIPVVREEVERREVPPTLERLNWIWLRGEDDVETGLAQVVEALDTDVAWRDAQARLTERAAEWERRKGDRSFVLRGSDLEDAEAWLADQAGHRERASELQGRYIVASRRSAQQRQRRTLGAVATALVVSIALTVFALVQRQLALDRERESRSRELSARAFSALETEPGAGVLLALRAFEADGNPRSEARLRQALASSPLRVTMRGHRGAVNGIAAVPGADLVVTAGLDGRVRLWRASTGAPVEGGPQPPARVRPPDPESATLSDTPASQQRKVLGHVVQAHGEMLSAHADPDGRFLATTDDRGGVRLWDLRKDREVHRLRAFGEAWTAEFSPDGRLLATGDLRGVRLFRAGDWRPLGRLGGGSAYNVAFSTDGRLLLAGGLDQRARLYDTATRRRVGVLRGHEQSVWDVALSPDGRFAATAGMDNDARLWDLRTRRTVARLQHEEDVNSVAFDATGRLLVTGSDDRTARIWDGRSGRALVTLRGHAGAVSAAEWTPSGRSIVTASEDGTARRWEMPPEHLAAPIRLSGVVHDTALDPTGDMVAAGGLLPFADVWDLPTRAFMLALEGHRADVVWTVEWSADGRRLLTAGDDGTARVYEPLGRGQLAVLPKVKDGVNQATFDRTGTRVATAGADGIVRVYRWSPVRLLAALEGHEVQVRGVAFDGSGTRLVSGGDDQVARIWELGTRRAVHELKGHTGSIEEVDYSADGARVVTAGADLEARVWNARSGRLERVLSVAGGEVVGAEIAPGGGMIVTGGDRIRLWDIRTGDVLSEWAVRRGGAASFAPDGRSILAQGGDDRLRVLPCIACRPIGDIAAAARRRVARTMDTAERDRVLSAP